MSSEKKTEGELEAIIQVRGVRTQFGAQVIHDGLDLDVYRGEVLGVVGGSGTGKSVLLREIIGLLRPAAGEIKMFDQSMWALKPMDRLPLLRRCGVLFQDGALFSSMTVAENVALPMQERGDLSKKFIDDTARVKLQMVGLPANAADKYPSELSGGMRKRAGLARALALDPDIVFLDEPTAGLDPISAADFDKLIRDLQQALGLTVFMVTHDLDSLIAICDRLAVLIDKRIVTGTITEVQKEGHPWVKEYFSGPRGRAAGAEQEKA
ncbi:MAG: ABC transporter ATP-binding protein [Alphaproteobacteria bacterium]|nr:ABC transporter ATP-binding protein [Alphaproteobacteria bacterium SS10]